MGAHPPTPVCSLSLSTSRPGQTGVPYGHVPVCVPSTRCSGRADQHHPSHLGRSEERFLRWGGRGSEPLRDRDPPPHFTLPTVPCCQCCQLCELTRCGSCSISSLHPPPHPPPPPWLRALSGYNGTHLSSLSPLLILVRSPAPASSPQSSLSLPLVPLTSAL